MCLDKVMRLQVDVSCLRQDISNLRTHFCSSAMVLFGVVTKEQAAADVNYFIRQMLSDVDSVSVRPTPSAEQLASFDICTPRVAEGNYSDHGVKKEHIVGDSSRTQRSFDEDAI